MHPNQLTPLSRQKYAHTDVRCQVVTHLEALNACEQFLTDHSILAEPACGASLIAVYSSQRELLTGFKSPLVTASGGATATVQQLEVWRQKLTESSRSSNL